MTDRVLVVGGYGVFGGRLAAQLLRDKTLDVIIAGRSSVKAEAFCARHGGRPAVFDIRAPNLSEEIKRFAPKVVVDAAGPFQSYEDAPYRLPKACIEAGAHYLDLSDDATFTRNIDSLDGAAKAKALAVLSGASSVPALSSAVVDHLSPDLSCVHLIESVILPGNRAPRGASLVRAIFKQAGRPISFMQGSEWMTAPGWGKLKSFDIEMPGHDPLRARLGSFITSPDLHLFPSRYRAHSVLFRAGLELKLLHLGLYVLSLPVRLGFPRSLLFLADPLRWIADRLERLGTDRGGMIVKVAGITKDGTTVERRWQLIAEAGDGPNIPALPAALMTRKLLAGGVPTGARPCLGEFTLAEAEAALSRFDIATHIDTTEIRPVFQQVLGANFGELPRPLQDLHTVLHRRVWRGEAHIERGKTVLSRIAAFIGGFPPAGSNVPVKVTMERTQTGEKWIRAFGSRSFTSFLRAPRTGDPRVLLERFGAFTFAIGLAHTSGTLQFPVERAWFLGLPVPKFLLPKSRTSESVDERGRCRFDVEISLSFGGLIVRYQGWLEPVLPD